MSSRERNMAIIPIALILLFGSAAVGYAFVYQPIQDKNRAALALDSEIAKKQEDYDKIKAEKQRLDVMKQRSLPPDLAIAKREYSEMMSRLLQQAKVPSNLRVRELGTDNTGTPVLAAKKLAYTKVAFEITFEKADMWAIQDFLQAYYKLDLLHQITLFEIKTDAQPASTTRGKVVNDRKDLIVKLISEAIILDGAEARRTLLSVPTAFAAIGGLPGYNALYLTPEASRGLSPIQFSPVLATRSRDYTLIVQNDIFHGPLPLPPSMTVEKIADISSEQDKPIAPVKVRVAGDLGPSGKVTLEAVSDGKVLPAGSLKIDQVAKTITLLPMAGETGSAEITVVAKTEDGKEAKTRFNVKITESEVAAETIKKLPDISDSIKLIMSVPGSDGRASAVVKDNYNPLTYEIEASASGRIKVTKFEHLGARKKKDRFYDDPELLILSDDGVSSTKRTFKVLAIDYDGMILSEVKAEKPVEKEKPKVPVGRPMGAARPENQGPAEALSLVAGAAATTAKSIADGQPTLFRWTCGTSLKSLKELPKDEAKKYLKAAETGAAVTATGN